MIAFVEANAPFFTWTGAVFVAAVAVGLVLWAVSGLWAVIVRLWHELMSLTMSSTQQRRPGSFGCAHKYHIDGRPLSGNAYYRCVKCGDVQMREMTRAASAAWRE